MGLTETGFVATRGSEFLTQIRDRIEAELNIEIDWGYGNVLGLLTTIMADLLGDVSAATQAVFDALDPGNATGLSLDTCCILVGITRKLPTKSTATVTLTGTAGTIVPEGSLVGGGGVNDDQQWKITADVTIGSGGTVDTAVTAITAGKVTAIAAAIDAIVTTVAGWTAKDAVVCPCIFRLELIGSKII